MKIKLILPVFSLLLLASICFLPVQAQSATPPALPEATPTYDPFAEPPLPEHPTQLELGKYVYWHHCMPCHGDVGQGLTDEFRALWVADHQNCWEAGCHSGRYSYDSFIVPTFVPPVTSVNRLARYTPNSLLEYLKATHPPQDPGWMPENDYQAVVAFLYELNGMSLPAEIATMTTAPPATPTSSITPTPSLPASQEGDPGSFPAFLLITVAFIVLAIIIFITIKRKQR